MKVASAILVLFAVGAQADIEFSRTVNTLAHASAKVTLDSGCTGTDSYGSNDCTLNWGESHTVTIAGSLAEDLDTGSTLDVDLTVMGIIPFKLSCPLCGANCTAKIPIINKQISIAMPACPLPKGSINKAISFKLPAKSPIPLSASASGTITITDQSGSTVASIALTAKLSPAATEVALSRSWLAAKAVAGGSDYEDPTANGGSCNAGEEAVRIQNVQGSFCSPSCATAACPTNVPAGTTASPECCLETPGSSKPGRCALICQASSKCPAKASCKMVQGSIGICTYDSR